MLKSVLEYLEDGNLFLTGEAGVGKSYMVNKIISHYYKNKREVIPLGSTGISAVNIGGFTVHSFFVFGISNNLEELIVSDKRAKKRLVDLKKILNATELIVIDEISMISSAMLDMILYRLETLDYRGKILLVGDFFQLPPVIKKKGSSSLFNDTVYAFESESWQELQLKVVNLKEMKRTDDKEFTDILQKIRVGNCDKDVVDYLTNIALNNRVYDINPTYLYGRNLEVEQTNRFQLNQLKTDETILFAKTKIHTKVNEKKLESWKKLLPISEELIIKEGAPILFTVNKWGKFVNGDRGIIKKIDKDSLYIKKGKEIIQIERHEFEMLDVSVDKNGSLELTTQASLFQFPIKLAYAVTIHKSQGMSINNLICDVNNIFAPSQFYVAISRATNPKNLKIDFKGYELDKYLKRVISVDKKVVEYYNSL